MTKPILFTPAMKSYLWGGTALMEKWGKTSPEATVAECWELSAYAGCESIARGGDCDGMPPRGDCGNSPGLVRLRRPGRVPDPR